MTRKIKCYGTYNGHQSGNIYNSKGLSPSLCSTDYKAPIKILEEREGAKIDLEENFTKVGEGKYVTTERERVVMRLPLALAVDHYIKNKTITC